MAAELLTGTKSDGYRVTRNIPLDNLQCQYYRDLVAGDIGPGGYIITQKDIDDKLYEKVGVNCASSDVSWLPNQVNKEYYTQNPLIGEGGENLPINLAFDPLNPYADQSKSLFTTNGDGLVIGGDDGEDGQLFGDSGDGATGCTGELNGCFVNGMATCEECPPPPGNGGYGDQGDPEVTIVYKCCDPQNMLSSDPSFTNNFGDACELFPCADLSSDTVKYYHQTNKCVVPAGNFAGQPHNIVYQYYDELRNLGTQPGQQADRYWFYPIYDRNVSSQYSSIYYIDKSIYDVSGPESYYDLSTAYGHTNPIYDSFQTGITTNGTQLYSLPKKIAMVCFNSDKDNFQSPNADAVYSVEELGGTAGLVIPSDSGYTPLSRKASGVGFCGGDIINDNIWDYFSSDDWKSYVVTFLLQQSWDIVKSRSGEANSEHKLTHAANPTNGFGLNWWLNESQFNTSDLDSLVNSLQSDSAKLKDVLFRLGFPLPPVTIGGDNNPDCTNTVVTGYRTVLNNFEIFIGIGTFFADFEIPDIKIEPTMKYSLDIKKGFDLRNEKINACDYIEFMTLPGGSSDGDGIYYKGNELPDEYFDNNLNDRAIIEAWDCNTEFNLTLRFSRMRAVCKDGSSVLMASAGSEGNVNFNLNYDNDYDFKFLTGKAACNSKLKQNSHQELYYLSDEDYRDSLGIYFTDVNNKFSDNFIEKFSDDEDDEFKQYALENYIKNSSGLDVNENITTLLDFDSRDEFTEGFPYLADGWSYIKIDTGQGTAGSDNGDYGAREYLLGNSAVNGMLPYWSRNNNNCYSYDKCLVFNTDLDSTESYDYRQGIYTLIDGDFFDFNQKRQNQEYKVSFMMKTKSATDTDLKDTGIHIIGAFDGVINKDQYEQIGPGNNYQADTTDYILSNYRYKKSGAGASTKYYKTTTIKSTFNSQCSKNTHYNNHFEEHNDENCRNCNINKDTYCDELRASFTNTQEDVWEKMEFTFRPYHELPSGPNSEHYEELEQNLSFYASDLKLIFTPIQVGVGAPFNYLAGGLNPDNNYILNAVNNNFPYKLTSYQGFSNNKLEDGDTQETIIDFQKGKAKVYIDDIKFTEAFDFHPDVDVRKYLTGETSQYSLTEYHNKNIDETKAPLKAQFYFYPRQPLDDVFSEERYPLLEEFKFGQFYISNIDWGDGSPNEFTTKPKKLGPSQMIYHTYEKSGVFEVKATMIRTRAETYEFDAYDPDNIYYYGTEGVGHNKNFSVKIFINKGTDDDFKAFGADGFTYIPFEETLPIIGGINKNSLYYKSLYRNLGFIDTNEETIRLNIPYNNLFDKYKSESSLLKMDNSLKNSLDIFNNYNDIEIPIVDTSSEYLATLPFPRYLEEFDIDGDGAVTPGVQGNTDTNMWITFGRPDIASFLYTYGTEDIPFSLDDNISNPYYNSPRVFINPTQEALNNYNNNNIYFDSIFEELGSSLGDVDLTNVKLYNKPQSIYDLLGFQCDEFSLTDIIPLTYPKTGANYSHHSYVNTNVDDIQSPQGAYSVTRIADNLIDTTANQPRVGYRFKINDSGAGITLMGTTPLSVPTPNLKYGEEYTFSTYVYNPDGNTNQGEGHEFLLRVKQTPSNTDWAGSSNPQDSAYCCTEEDFNNDGCSGMSSGQAQGWSYYEDCYWNNNGVMTSQGEYPLGMDTIILDRVQQDISETWQRLSGTFTPLNPELYGEYLSFQVLPEKENGSGLGVGFDDDYTVGGTPAPENLTEDKYYVWGAQLEKGNVATDFITTDIDLGDCLETYAGIPTNEKYWKNTIPKDYSIYNREGINLNANMEENGSLTINTYSEQDWLDEYYYPVLPKYGQDGKFIETIDEDGNYILDTYSNNKIPFPLEAPITNENELNENLILNIDVKKSSDDEFLNDKSGNNNLGFVIGDYKQNFDNKTFETKKTRFMNKIKNKKDKGAF